MTLESNVKRMFWRLQQGTFKVNQDDVKAMTEIAKWINNARSEKLREQQLFAKLFVKELTRNFCAVRNLKEALYLTHSSIETSLHSYVKEFAFHFNVLALKNHLEDMNMTWVEEPYETEDDKELVTDFIKKDKDFLKYSGGYWSEDKIAESLSKEIYEAYEKYKDLI